MITVFEQEKGGVSFFIEASPEPVEIVNIERAGGEQAGVKEELKKLRNRLDDISSTISEACKSIQTRLPVQSVEGSRIEEIEIEFGINLSVEAGVIITKASGECTMKVTAKIKLI